MTHLYFRRAKATHTLVALLAAVAIAACGAEQEDGDFQATVAEADSGNGGAADSSKTEDTAPVDTFVPNAPQGGYCVPNEGPSGGGTGRATGMKSQR